MVSQAFIGRRPFNKLTAPVITLEIINGRQLACPQEVQGLCQDMIFFKLLF